MNLKEDVTKYIQSMGIETASHVFKRTPATIKGWIKTGAYPIDVVEDFITQGNGAGNPGPSTDAPPLAEELEQPSLEQPSLVQPSLEQRVQRIEDYLQSLNPVPEAPAQANLVPWSPPSPADANYRSFVRPDAGVPGRTLATPAPPSAPPQAGVRPGLVTADTWLTPIPRK